MCLKKVESVIVHLDFLTGITEQNRTEVYLQHKHISSLCIAYIINIHGNENSNHSIYSFQTK